MPGIGNECPIDRVVQKGAGSMSNEVFTIDRIKEIVKPIALKYHAEEIYLFGSYAETKRPQKVTLIFLSLAAKTSN